MNHHLNCKSKFTITSNTSLMNFSTDCSQAHIFPCKVRSQRCHRDTDFERISETSIVVKVHNCVSQLLLMRSSSKGTPIHFAAKCGNCCHRQNSITLLPKATLRTLQYESHKHKSESDALLIDQIENFPRATWNFYKFCSQP